MTRKIAAGCFAAMFGLAVSAGAQTPPPSSPQTPSQPPSSPTTPPASPTSPYPSGQAPSADRAAGSAKITGCVQAGTAANSFELTNVKKGSSSMASSATTPPAGAPAAASTSDKATVKLVASPSVDLAAHVGHTVEVSGSWAKGAADATASPSAPAPAAGAKEFSVSSVKMVSSTCSAGTN